MKILFPEYLLGQIQDWAEAKRECRGMLYAFAGGDDYLVFLHKHKEDGIMNPGEPLGGEGLDRVIQALDYVNPWGSEEIQGILICARPGKPVLTANDCCALDNVRRVAEEHGVVMDKIILMSSEQQKLAGYMCLPRPGKLQFAGLSINSYEAVSENSLKRYLPGFGEKIEYLKEQG